MQNFTYEEIHDYWTLYCPSCHGVISHIKHSDGNITAGMVKELREMTGASMISCRNALKATGGDMTAAQDFIKNEGFAVLHVKRCRHCGQPVYVPGRFVWRN